MGRFARGVTVLLVIALLAASAASAATPTQIYRDYQDNGRLDGRYSVADLQAALSSPAVQGYGSPTITPGMKQKIVSKLGAQQGLSRREQQHGRWPAVHGLRPGTADGRRRAAALGRASASGASRGRRASAGSP